MEVGNSANDILGSISVLLASQVCKLFLELCSFGFAMTTQRSKLRAFKILLVLKFGNLNSELFSVGSLFSL